MNVWRRRAFKGAKGGFLWNLRCIAGIRRWQEVLRRLSWWFKNGRVFSSGTGEFINGDVAVADGIVIGVGTYEGETEIDLVRKSNLSGVYRQSSASGIYFGDAG